MYVCIHKYSHTYTLRLECICCTLTHNIYTAHSFYEMYSTVQLQLHTRVTLHAWFHATFYMWNVNISCVNHYLHETRMRKFTQNRKCHNTTSVITRQKCVVYATHGRGYVQRNPQELLNKPHDDTVAQLTVYVATLYSQFICIVYCKYSDAWW